jgi:hypothetical protein
MATVKLDIQDGSVLELGIIDAAATRAVRRGIVRDTAEQTTYDALLSVYAEAGPFHPDVPNELPLDELRGYRWGTDKVLFQAIYRYRPGNGFGGPVATLAAFHSTYEHVRVYRRATSFDPVSGLPAGDMDILGSINDINAQPIARIWLRPALHIAVPVILHAHPFVTHPGLADLVGTTNSGPIIFSGVPVPGNYGPNRVRYDGAEIVALSNLQYRVQYNFTAIGAQWKEQFAVFTGNPPEWTTEQEDIYDRADFDGMFPG